MVGKVWLKDAAGSAPGYLRDLEETKFASLSMDLVGIRRNNLEFLFSKILRR